MQKLINVSLMGGGAIALLTCLFISSAVAQQGSATISGPSNIPEGGLVAQAIQDFCKTGRYYCEYRDGDNDDTNLRPQRVKD